MQLLIDTQAIIWFQDADSKLSRQAKDLISDKSNTCFISIASLWEIAIKINLNKLTIGMEFENFPEYLINHNFQILGLKFSHLKSLSTLNNFHKDPFDRLLIAQAISENISSQPIGISRNTRYKFYGDNNLLRQTLISYLNN